MWTDNEAEYDFLNFTGVAKTVAQVIEDAQGRPVSVGVSGSWGVGKSSLIGFIKSELSSSTAESKTDERQYIFVDFNAWLYQGYDDARAALIETVATTLLAEAQKRETNVDKVKGLLKRVDWLRALKTSATSAAYLALGLPPVGLVSDLVAAGKGLVDGDISKADVDGVKDLASDIKSSSGSYLKPEEKKTPPSEISALRDDFESILEELGLTLVVLIDDLDRCLPDTTISTLEAIRLLLFLKHTAFVIAADDKMIKHAVKRHFNGVDDELVTNYFDKLIQVPIRVPPLGTQEVRAYMMLLHIENSSIERAFKDKLRLAICDQLTKTWQGQRVDLNFVQSTVNELPAALLSKLDSACRLAPIMTSADQISGNPRLIKRFLNAISIRMAMARSQSITVDEAVLAKILLFERCGEPTAYAQLVKSAVDSESGKPEFLGEWESGLAKGQDVKPEAPWNEEFCISWMKLSPQLADRDLRGALYVSREHAPLITAEDQLSPEAMDILRAFLDQPEMAASVKGQLISLSKHELALIMGKVLDRANRIQEWGAPPELQPLLVISEQSPLLSKKFVDFMKDRPGAQIKPNIIPKLSGETWTRELFDFWLEVDDVSEPVKRSIRTRKNNGNLAV